MNALTQTVPLDDVTALRLQLLRNGYTPLANRDKKCFLLDWPELDVTEELITKRWSRMLKYSATGIRVENGLAVIDLDIDDKELIDRIADRINEAIPELGDPATPLLVRHGKGAKEAWFVRTAEEFSRIHSRAWIKPGETVDDGAHRVEIFGGGSARQFGAFGPHTLNDDGSVKIAYRWEDRSPLDTPLADLPILTKQQFFTIVDIVEEELERAGWAVVKKTTRGENITSREYTLTDNMTFDCDDHVTRSLAELRVIAGDGLRCSASWLEGPSAKRIDRCLISLAHDGGVAIHETASGVTHHEQSRKPRDYGPELDRAREQIKELQEKERNKIAPTDSAFVAATKLLATYAFCPNQQLGIVPIYTSSMTSGIAMQAFRTMMLPNADEETGKLGGRILINPVDIWAKDERRITVQGLRMRPDKARPIYEDAEGKWINTYTPPAHDAAGGSPEAGQRLLAQLLPDPDELRWFTQWLAHKVRFPGIPGPAVIMVARAYGTGRGTLSKLIAEVLGPRYVKEMPFHMFGGKSYQSQYDDWGASALVVTIAEVSDGKSSSTYAEKHNTYTHLKAQVSPEPRMRHYVSKREHFEAMAFTTYFVATNDTDALPIPADDRRFAVLTNGDNASPEFWTWMHERVLVDANVAAFHAYLQTVDLAGYNPMAAPPRTDGLLDMVDLNKSDIDKGFDLAFEALTTEVYTPDQIVDLMVGIAAEYDLNYHGAAHDGWKQTVKRMAAKRGFRVGVRNGVNWHPQIGNKRLAVYATTQKAATYWKLHDRLVEEVLKNRVKPVGEKLGGLGDGDGATILRLRTRCST